MGSGCIADCNNFKHTTTLSVFDLYRLKAQSVMDKKLFDVAGTEQIAFRTKVDFNAEIALILINNGSKYYAHQ